jgi:hypothetical protein
MSASRAINKLVNTTTRSPLEHSLIHEITCFVLFHAQFAPPNSSFLTARHPTTSFNCF